MKTLGLIGGMTWQSTVEYYRILNEEVKRRLGGYHSAQCLIYSVDFSEIEECLQSGKWERVEAVLSSAAQSLEKGGADGIIICANAPHKIAQEIQEKISIPILHIAEATAEKILEQNIKAIGLLGTKQIMENNFYKSYLENKGLQVVLPNEEGCELINTIIYNELCLGIISEEAKNQYKGIISSLVSQGAEGVILGCKKLTYLIKAEESEVPLFDTASIHALKSVDFMLDG